MLKNIPQTKSFFGVSSSHPKAKHKRTYHCLSCRAKDAINTVLVQEVETEERKVYFISRVLHGVEIRYQMIEKVTLSLIIIAQRMRMYFHNHRIIGRTDYPIMKILAKPDLVRRMIGWVVELSEYQIHYQPKGQLNHKF